VSSPLDFTKSALDAANTDPELLAAVAAGLARHRDQARRQLVLDLLVTEAFADKLALVEAHHDVLDQLDEAHDLLTERLRVVAVLQGVPVA
jgi:hypothetical protein